MRARKTICPAILFQAVCSLAKSTLRRASGGLPDKEYGETIRRTPGLLVQVEGMNHESNGIQIVKVAPQANAKL